MYSVVGCVCWVLQGSCTDVLYINTLYFYKEIKIVASNEKNSLEKNMTTN